LEAIDKMNVDGVYERLRQKIHHCTQSIIRGERLRVAIKYDEFAVIKVKHHFTLLTIPRKIWSIQVVFYLTHRYQYEIIIRSFDPDIAIEKVVEVFSEK
jgi:hypothetical protein